MVGILRRDRQQAARGRTVRLVEAEPGSLAVPPEGAGEDREAFQRVHADATRHLRCRIHGGLGKVADASKPRRVLASSEVARDEAGRSAPMGGEGRHVPNAEVFWRHPLGEGRLTGDEGRPQGGAVALEAGARERRSPHGARGRRGGRSSRLVTGHPTSRPRGTTSMSQKWEAKRRSSIKGAWTPPLLAVSSRNPAHGRHTEREEVEFCLPLGSDPSPNVFEQRTPVALKCSASRSSRSARQSRSESENALCAKARSHTTSTRLRCLLACSSSRARGGTGAE